MRGREHTRRIVNIHTLCGTRGICRRATGCKCISAEAAMLSKALLRRSKPSGTQRCGGRKRRADKKRQSKRRASTENVYAIPPKKIDFSVCIPYNFYTTNGLRLRKNNHKPFIYTKDETRRTLFCRARQDSRFWIPSLPSANVPLPACDRKPSIRFLKRRILWNF